MEHLISDGMTFKSLPPAQNYKRLFEKDKGPNTGGIGCSHQDCVSGSFERN
jgi:phosphoribosylamine-glycine ligase